MDERVSKSYRERAEEYFAAHPRGATPEQLFGPPVIDPELPPFWKPEEPGEKRLGEVFAVRRTKDFGEGQGRGEAIYLRGPEGLYSIPIGANLKNINWHHQIGMVFLFEFKGWQELEEGNRCRTWEVRPLKQGHPGLAIAEPEGEDVPF